jgi:hypothetical protein
MDNNFCSCEKNFNGDQCQFTTCFGKSSIDPSVCSGNGNCTEPDGCICKDGYDGNSCENNLIGISSLYTFGKNLNGQLGDGTNNPISVPKKLPVHGAIQIFSGTTTNFFINNASKAFGFGWNNVNFRMFNHNYSIIKLRKIEFLMLTRMYQLFWEIKITILPKLQMDLLTLSYSKKMVQLKVLVTMQFEILF